MNKEVVEGAGWTVGHLDALGEGPGFRKIRAPLGVTAFGVNAIVLPPGVEAGAHYHDEQEELYFVHRGELEMEFGDGTTHRMPAGSLARVAPETVRKFRNVGDEDAVFVVVGGKDGYVGRDGHVADGGERVRPVAS